MTCDPKSRNRQEQLLDQVATEGKLCVTWEELKICIIEMLQVVYMKYVEQEKREGDSAKLYDKLKSLVRNCQKAPFTIQRISELLLNPTYTSFEKFCHSFEKLFHVVSFVSEGEGLFTSNLLYLRNEKNPGWHVSDSESSCSSTETEILSDAENSTTAVSDAQTDNVINGIEEDSTSPEVF